ncbi:MAG TPA: DUF3467 domain-containing protein [Pirellulales bacterium]|nr:DUF3467 domain-containing protein [Pirellulales bacterium]
MAEPSHPPAGAPLPTGLRPGSSVSVDSSNLSANYINFCRVVGMPEELIIDFGLSTDPVDGGQAALIASERVVLSYYTGKRMLEALQLTIQRHEAAFGTVETSTDKRIVPGFKG